MLFPAQEVVDRWGSVFFPQVKSDRTKGNSLKVHWGRFRLDMRRTFFTERAAKLWNRLSREVVDSPFLEVLKKMCRTEFFQ